MMAAMVSEIIPTQGEKKTGALGAGTLSRVLSLLERDGYLVVRGVCAPDHLDAVRAAMDAAWGDFQRHPRWIGGGRIIGHLNCTPPTTRDLIFDDVLVNPIVHQITAARLGLGTRNVKYAGNTNVPGSVPQMFHSDVPDPTEQTLVVNIPLGDVTAANGATELIPGTHKRAYRFSEIWAREKAGDYLRAETTAGDVLIRFPGLLHRGAANPSDRPRYMLGLWHVPQGSTRDRETAPLQLGADCADWAVAHAEGMHYTVADPVAPFSPNYFAPGLKGALVETAYRLAPGLYRAVKAWRD